MDAVIHNAGVYGDRDRHPSPEGHPRMLTVNTLAPYLLTGLIERPDRLIYLTSDMHVSGDDSLHDLDWSSRRWNGTQAYCDSKLFVTALALAVARRWPDVISHAVDPGWVPTRMGGPSASDDLEQGHLTQTWLATTDDPEAMRSAARCGNTADQPRSRPPPRTIAASRTDSSTSWPRKPGSTSKASAAHEGSVSMKGVCGVQSARFTGSREAHPTGQPEREARRSESFPANGLRTSTFKRRGRLSLSRLAE